MKTLETAVIFLALFRLVSPATSQEPPPNPEADIIRQLTSDGPYEWLEGVARGLAVPATERSPALLAAMIEALGREVEWKRHRTGPSDPSFEDVGEAFGESSAILARELAATGDPTILPALAWHARLGSISPGVLGSRQHGGVRFEETPGSSAKSRSNRISPSSANRIRSAVPCGAWWCHRRPAAILLFFSASSLAEDAQ